MKKLFVLMLLCLLVVPKGYPAEGREDVVHELEEVVVTATQKKKVIDTPASISIITAKELQKMGAKNIIEALNKIPGVIDTSENTDSITIRGQTSPMSGGPVILIDGIAQKIGDYRYDRLGFIPVSQVERVEVLRSPGIAYGPGSARGVISIITKKGTINKPFSSNVSASYGSWNTHNESVDISGRARKWDYLISAADYGTDGYEEEKTDRNSVLLKLGYNPSEQTRIGLRSSYVDSDVEIAYGLNKYEYQLDNYRRSIHFPQSETDPDLVWHNEREQDVSTIAVELSHQEETFFLDASADYTKYNEKYIDSRDIFYSSSSSRGDIDDRNQDVYTFNLSGGYNFRFGEIFFTPSMGFRYEDIRFDQRKTYPYGPSLSTNSVDIDIHGQGTGLFWDNDILFGDNWELKIGGRADEEKLVYEDKVPSRVSQSETVYSWFTAPSYHFSDKANIYVSAGKNFWFPTPRYYAWAADRGGNENRPEDLKPEKSLTYEIGYRNMVHRAFNITTTCFYTEYKDKFASLYDTSGTWKGMKNLGEAESKGIEMEIDGRFLQKFGYRLAGSYMDIAWTKGQVRVNDHPSNANVTRNLDGYDIHGIPKYTGTVGFDYYHSERLKFSVDTNTSGSYYVDYLNRIKYPSKTTVDAQVSYAIRNWKLWLLGKNIFDEKIERAINSTGRLTKPNGDYRNAYYVQDGRYIEIGVSCHF